MSVIDLRSDTVTHPSPEMRDAIYDADIGDDVFSDDPSVNKLEAKSADIMGKEAAVFVASGTMGNLVSILTHCNRGDEIIVGDKSHTFFYEAGGVSDDISKLNQNLRPSYGLGFRAIISSLIYRFDLAVGDDGFAPTIFIIHSIRNRTIKIPLIQRYRNRNKKWVSNKIPTWE